MSIIFLEVFVADAGQSVKILQEIFSRNFLRESLKNVLKSTANFPISLPNSNDFSTCYPFGRMKILLPGMNKLLLGILFSLEDKNMNVSFLLGSKIKEICLSFTYFSRFSGKKFSAETLPYPREGTVNKS